MSFFFRTKYTWRCALRDAAVFFAFYAVENCTRGACPGVVAPMD